MRKPHFTIDTYGSDKNDLDLPIMCIHVYEDGNVEAFDTPHTYCTKVLNVILQVH